MAEISIGLSKTGKNNKCQFRQIWCVCVLANASGFFLDGLACFFVFFYLFVCFVLCFILVGLFFH